MQITKDIRYVGVNDHKIDLFEGIYEVPNGMAYNSYVVLGEKVAVVDSVEKGFSQEWIGKIKAELDGRTPDYLIVQHMEPDHSSSIDAFVKAFPAAVIVASAMAFSMMKLYFGDDFADRRIVVKEGDVLPLGGHTLRFITAPMVHWPEVIMTYDEADGVFFSADAFGKFGALDVEEEWACEARRYYFGIVGKYGVQVQAVLKKAAAFDIRMICPLHGPAIKDDLEDCLNLYRIWSSYGVESEGVLIAYTSVYGHTKEAVEILARKLREKGQKVVVDDLARCDMAEAVEDAFRYGKIVLATTTYNGDAFPFMREFLHHLAERNFRGRRIGMMENGSWVPMAAKVMRGLLEGCKELTYVEPTVKILAALTEENLAQIDALAEEMAK